MLSARTIESVTKYWTECLGCSATDLSQNVAVLVSRESQPGDDCEILAFLRDAAPVISAPLRLGELVAFHAGEMLILDLDSTIQFAASIAGADGTVLGPAQIAYIDAETLKETDDPSRLLVPGDERFVRDLEASCTAIEWEHGGSKCSDLPAAGVFVEGQLVSLASYEVWGDTIAHIAIITHPQFRGRGYARMAVARIARYALAAGLVPQYRTLLSNAPSLRVTDALGFCPYGASVLIRLGPDRMRS